MTVAASARIKSERSGAGSMERFAEEMLRYYAGKKSATYMLSLIHRLFAWLGEAGVRTTDDLDDAAIRRLEKVLPAHLDLRTRLDLLGKCRAMCNHGVRLGLLRSCPAFPPIKSARHFPRKYLITRLSGDDVKRLWHCLRARTDTWEGNRLFALISVVVLAGLLREEALALEVDDLDMEKGMIRVRRREGFKYTRLPPRVPISRELRMVLEEWLPRVKCKWVFPGRTRSGPWRGGGFSRTLLELTRAARSVGIEGEVRFMALRQFYAENAITNIPFTVGARRLRPKADRPKPIPSIRVRGPKSPVLVRGKPKGPLTPAQYDAISLLLRHFPDGLSMKEMNERSKMTAWRSTLRRLSADPDWGSAIGFPEIGYPGKDTGNYRILPL